MFRFLSPYLSWKCAGRSVEVGKKTKTKHNKKRRKRRAQEKPGDQPRSLALSALPPLIVGHVTSRNQDLAGTSFIREKDWKINDKLFKEGRGEGLPNIA